MSDPSKWPDSVPNDSFQGTPGRLTFRQRLDAMIAWLFRNRQTGRMTVAQLPNAPLIVFLVAVAVRWIFHPSGTAGTIVGAVATVALVIWAGDEIIRGVNPWRRALGGGVLAITIVGILVR